MKNRPLQAAIFFLLLFFLHTNVSAQRPKLLENGTNPAEIYNSTSERIEFALKRKNEGVFTTENLGDKGMLLAYDSDQKSETRGLSTLYFVKVSTEMKVDYSEGIGIKKKYDIQYKAKEKDNIYYLLAKSSGQITNYQVLCFNYNTMQSDLYEGSLGHKTKITQFWVKDGFVHITGNNYKSKVRSRLEILGSVFTLFMGPFLWGWWVEEFSRPVFVSIDMKSKKSSKYIWNATQKNQVFVRDLCLTESSDYAEIFLEEKWKKKRTSWYMQVRDGMFQAPQKFQFPGNLLLTTINSHRFGPSEEYLTGYYSDKTKPRLDLGIYFTQFKDGKVVDFSPIPFAKLTSAKEFVQDSKYAYLSSSKMYQHQMRKRGGENIFIGEFYYSTYKQVEYLYYNNGRWETRYRDVFIGYEHSNLRIISFSDKGEILWQRCLDISDMAKSFYEGQSVHITEDAKGDLLLVYKGKLSGSDSKPTIVVNKFEFEGKNFGERKTNPIYEKLAVDSKNTLLTYGIEYWYKNYFKVFSTQVNTSNYEKDKNAARSYIIQ